MCLSAIALLVPALCISGPSGDVDSKDSGSTDEEVVQLKGKTQQPLKHRSSAMAAVVS